MVISKLKVGDTVWSITRHKLGSTNIPTVSVHPVLIVEVNETSVIHNKPKPFGLNSIKGWKKEKPVLIKGLFGSQRLATRAEVAALQTQ
ncbi:hypothetical protein [Providencia huashanensis]|uniref:hypothetical protein n=1 Tax=Providencia huashanensis TaxID=3037798 RepID=UPI00271248CB|nr:hypothetical protein [Providencia sp. CRE-138-0026]MDO7833314.1 hypothetical protein [Providencia sp. CRE-138-0026]